MKGKILNFNYLKKEKGSAMMVVLLILVVVPVLGMALLSATSSNFKLTGREREFQSVYYVAEAGINHVMYDIRKKVDELSEETFSHEEFFDFLDEYISDKYIDGESNPFILNEFKKNFGEFPQAEIEMVIDAEDITVDGNTSYSKGVKSYTINSKGEIGKLSRTVSTSIEIAHRIETNTEPSSNPVFDFVMYSPTPLELQSGSIVYGDFYSRDIVLKSANSQVNGNIISETFIDIMGNGNPRIRGNVYALDGDIYVSKEGGTSAVEGNVHANGDVTIGSSGTVYENVFSDGDITMESANAKVMGNIHANGNIEMKHGTSVEQNVYLGGNLKLYSINSTIYGDVFAGGNIYMGDSTYIKGDSQAGGNINEHNINNINMQIHPNNKPIKPEFPIIDKISPPNLTPFDVGIDNIKLEENWKNPNVQPVLPGHYNNLEINYGNTIGFSSGDYYFRNIEAGNSAIKIKYDLFNGPINIYVKEHIEFGGTLEVFASKDGENYTKIDSNLWDNNPSLAIEIAGKVYWETHDNFKMAENCCFLGTILSKGDITTVSGAEIIGSYCTTDGLINIAQNSKIMYAPPIDSAAGNSENNGGTGNGNENNEGQNITCRIEITSPVREK